MARGAVSARDGLQDYGALKARLGTVVLARELVVTTKRVAHAVSTTIAERHTRSRPSSGMSALTTTTSGAGSPQLLGRLPGRQGKIGSVPQVAHDLAHLRATQRSHVAIDEEHTAAIDCLWQRDRRSLNSVRRAKVRRLRSFRSNPGSVRASRKALTSCKRTLRLSVLRMKPCAPVVVTSVRNSGSGQRRVEDHGGARRLRDLRTHACQHVAVDVGHVDVEQYQRRSLPNHLCQTAYAPCSG